MIGIVDYGMGNLRSVEKAFQGMGFPVTVTSDPSVLQQVSGMVIPGVGAFPDAMDHLTRRRLIEPIMAHVEKGKPLLGICLGMQVLFQEGYEGEKRQGLGILPGQVVKIPPGRKIPHMGWNRLTLLQDCPVLKGVPSGSYVYFVHSYFVDNLDAGHLAALTDYGLMLPAVVQKDRIFGLQFHPEKSSDTGLQMIKNFGELSQC